MLALLERYIQKVEVLVRETQSQFKTRVTLLKFLIQSWLSSLISRSSILQEIKVFNLPIFENLLKSLTKLDGMKKVIYTEAELEELLNLKLDPVTQKAVSEALVAAYTKRFLKLVKGA